MTCQDLDQQWEALADGSAALSTEERAHLEGCARCQRRLEEAHAIERLLDSRETPVVPPHFTAAVMARIGEQRWRTERVVDIGFNLALLAGAAIILAGAVGLGWSLGVLTIRIDLDTILAVLNSALAPRLASQAQTVALAAGLLTMALALWWWAEADST